MNDFDTRVMAALDAEADRVAASPALYESVTGRIGARRRRTGLVGVLAVATVVVAAAVVLPRVLDEPTGPTILDQPTEGSTSRNAPTGFLIASADEVRVVSPHGAVGDPSTCGSCGGVYGLAALPDSRPGAVGWMRLAAGTDGVMSLTGESIDELGADFSPNELTVLVGDEDARRRTLASDEPRSDRPLAQPGIAFSNLGDHLAWSVHRDGRTLAVLAPVGPDGVDLDAAEILDLDLDGAWRLTDLHWHTEYADSRLGTISLATLGDAALVSVIDTAASIEVVRVQRGGVEAFGFDRGGWDDQAPGAALLHFDSDGLTLSTAWATQLLGHRTPTGPFEFGGPPLGVEPMREVVERTVPAPEGIEPTRADLAAAGGTVAIAVDDRLWLHRDGAWSAMDVPAHVVAVFGPPSPAAEQVDEPIGDVFGAERGDEPGADTPTTPAWVVVNTGTEYWIERVDGGGRIELGSAAPELAVDAIEVRPGGTPDLLDSVLVRRLASGGWEYHRMNRVDGTVTFTGFPPQYQPDPATRLGAPVPAFSPDGRHLAWVEGTRDEVTLRTVGWTDRAPGTGNTADDNASFVLPIELVGDELTVRSWTWWDEASLARPDVRDAAYPTQAVGSLLLVDDLGLAYDVEVERQADGALTVGQVGVVSHVEEPPAGWVTTQLFSLVHADDIGNIWAADLSWPPFGGVSPGGRSSSEYRPYLLDDIAWGSPAAVVADAWAEGLLVATDGRGYVATTVGLRQIDATVVDLDWLTGDVIR